MIIFEPNGDRVLIRPFTENELRGAKFSIIVTGEQDKAMAQQGEIIAAGNKAVYKVGDLVIFNPSAGDVIRRPNGVFYEELRMVHSDTIISLFKDEEKA
jgi:co-chaperonin GroES (HSP10)